MLEMTRNFLIKAHEAFDELGYHPISSNFSLKYIKYAAVNTINHSKTLDDGINAARMYQFVVNNFDKICDKVSRHYDFWSSMKWEGNELISLCSNEEAIGTYFVTNAFDKEYKNISLMSYSFGDGIAYDCSCKHGKFILDEDNEYILRYSKMSSTKMVLLNNNEEKLCVVVLSDNCDIFLENNKTGYEIVLYKGFIGIYEKSYIDSLHGQKADTDKLIGVIEWDILEKDNEYGLARLELYDSNADLEMFLMFAMSCFLLFRSHMQSIRTSNAATNALILSSWARR